MKGKYDELVCPLGKFPLKQEGNILLCTNCDAAFSIIDSIPNLLLEDIILPKGINAVSELKCFKVSK